MYPMMKPGSGGSMPGVRNKIIAPLNFKIHILFYTGHVSYSRGTDGGVVLEAVQAEEVVLVAVPWVPGQAVAGVQEVPVPPAVAMEAVVGVGRVDLGVETAVGVHLQLRPWKISKRHLTTDPEHPEIKILLA